MNKIIEKNTRVRVKMTHQKYYSLLTHEFTARKRIKKIYIVCYYCHACSKKNLPITRRTKRKNPIREVKKPITVSI